ncbi:N-acetyl-gamma-glutamyl-phosphate reductase [Alkalibacter rhizosphaerae]|uniref:N-acetyl-gamma-glutamyl-phosphate reductase n=1 Tax=Alkalibacter rhizosphaerae TaxID=2815577 RepID=A0A974XEI8_9FIRM|nr:N-acetyl-gamma-glutamyl-phosphate reductase [Alkalibacter rhizosphaerae]QSX08291.1 N-acetyl-gamma-glutamyl-phosphate reductase [Alkalibacter rhizosphaerae]
MIKASVVGASGYVGQELIRLLWGHPQVEIVHITSTSKVGEAFHHMYGNYKDIFDKEFVPQDLEKIAEESDVMFLALPHGVASGLVTDSILKKTKVIDMGADYRLKDLSEYEAWYKTTHESPELMEKSIYGLCEIEGPKIAEYDLIANPGCYTTCSILTLAPLMRSSAFDLDSIVIDAKSGVTGAGRGLNLGTHFTECNESIKAYSVAAHRHTPEIEEQLSTAAGRSIRLIFTPHLVPMNRGILATCYIRLKEKMTWEDVDALYQDFYKDKPFVRTLPKGSFPETKWVKGSNYCDIGWKVDERTNTLVAIGAIDNLVKGAAGQGVQNMNILFGLKETEGLDLVPVFPV